MSAGKRILSPHEFDLNLADERKSEYPVFNINCWRDTKNQAAEECVNFGVGGELVGIADSDEDGE